MGSIGLGNLKSGLSSEGGLSRQGSLVTGTTVLYILDIAIYNEPWRKHGAFYVLQIKTMIMMITVMLHCIMCNNYDYNNDKEIDAPMDKKSFYLIPKSLLAFF